MASVFNVYVVQAYTGHPVPKAISTFQLLDSGKWVFASCPDAWFYKISMLPGVQGKNTEVLKTVISEASNSNSVTFHHTLRENNVHQTSFLPFPFPYKGNHRGPALVCSPYTIPPSRKDPQNFRENHKSRFYVNEKVIKPCKYQQN